VARVLGLVEIVEVNAHLQVKLSAIGLAIDKI
jgi:hypothetical protein